MLKHGASRQNGSDMKLSRLLATAGAGARAGLCATLAMSLLMSDYHLPVNIGNPDEISLRDFAEEIIALTGIRQKIVFRPLPEDDPKQRQPDITRARQLLGWEPVVDRKKGLALTYAYFQSLPRSDLFRLPKEFISRM